MSFDISCLVSENVYVQSQHVKTEIFADCIRYSNFFFPAAVHAAAGCHI